MVRKWPLNREKLPIVISTHKHMYDDISMHLNGPRGCSTLARGIVCGILEQLEKTSSVRRAESFTFALKDSFAIHALSARSCVGVCSAWQII